MVALCWKEIHGLAEKVSEGTNGEKTYETVLEVVSTRPEMFNLAPYLLSRKMNLWIHQIW